MSPHKVPFSFLDVLSMFNSGLELDDHDIDTAELCLNLSDIMQESIPLPPDYAKAILNESTIFNFSLVTPAIKAEDEIEETWHRRL